MVMRVSRVLMSFGCMRMGSRMIALRMVLGCFMVGFRCVLVVLCRLLVCVVGHRSPRWSIILLLRRPYAPFLWFNIYDTLRSRADSAMIHPVDI